MRPVEDGAEAVPGVRAVAAHGPTPGHTCFHVADGSARMMYLADTTHRPELAARRPDFHIVLDFDPVAAEASRRRMLDRVSAERMRVNGYMAKEGGGYRFVPADWASGA